MSNFKTSIHNIKAFAFDVDGVFTNGEVYLHPDGDMMRAMNIKDGYAVQYCVKQGYPVAIITGGSSPMVKKRFENLGITDIYMGSHHKMDNLEDFIYKYGLQYEEILYMGDDIPDFDVMNRVGVATCPCDAVPEIKSVATYISDKPGGGGCVRDVIEQVLRLHHKWMGDGAVQW
ncbi:MAG: KdsC family phosphatase [Bacteroidota bacterium]